MGRGSYSNRLTVEECETITTSFLNKHKYFDGGVYLGELAWRLNGEKTGSIVIVVSTVENKEYIRFLYVQTNRGTSEKTELDYIARLESTPCYFGGRRWWFSCTLITNGRVCGRRVGSLHLAGSEYFGCRHCHNLTYKSCKENHHFDAYLKRKGIDPKRFNQSLKRIKRKG